MGQVSNLCGEDIFKKLIEQYGDDFTKFILAQKSKDVIRDKFRDLNIESDNKFGEFQAKVNAVVDQKLQSLDKTFQSAKSSVESVIPGGISTLERLKGESINEFSGYNKLQNKVDGVRDQALNAAENQKNRVMTDLQGKKTEMITTIEAERPKIPIYEQLPQGIRSEILRKGEKQFAEQIQSNKEGILKRLMDQFLPQSFKMISQFLNQMNPQNPLSSILQNAFGQMTGNITSVSGSQGGFMNNIKKIF